MTIRCRRDGVPPATHLTMLYEIFARGTWAEYRQALESNWRPSIDGARSLAEAAASLIAALQDAAAARGAPSAEFV